MAKGTCQECGKKDVNLRRVGQVDVCAQCVSIVRSRQFRENLQNQQKAFEQQQKKEFYQKRIEIAQKGKAALQSGNPVEALRNYLLYIDVVEESFKCGEGGLSPNLYNPQHRDEAAEMLLIAVIYWDLAKIYDKIPTKRREFKQAIAKVDLFSYGMPYQVLLSETIRKHINSKKASNVSDFEALYARLKPKKKCYIATAIYNNQDHEHVRLLRRFRDDYLVKNIFGFIFVKFYYFSMPVFELIVLESSTVRKIIKRVIERVINEYIRPLYHS